MMGNLDARDRRAVVLGIAATAGLLVLFRVLPAWWGWRLHTRATATETITQWQRAEGVVKGLSQALDTMEARIARLRQLGPVFVTGETPAEAAATLGGLVGEIARASQVRLDAIDVRVDSSDATRLPRVRLDAQATADVTGLAELLRRLEDGVVWLTVPRLSVRAPPVAGPPNDVEMLSLRFSVEGIALLRSKEDAR